MPQPSCRPSDDSTGRAAADRLAAAGAVSSALDSERGFDVAPDEAAHDVAITDPDFDPTWWPRQGIERRLAMRADEDWRGDELLALPELAYLRNKSREELLSIQQTTQVELKRYEEGLRIAATILAERGEQVR